MVRYIKQQHTFGRVESSNLDEVVTFRPLELVHLLLSAQGAEFSHVELGIPINSR